MGSKYCHHRKLEAVPLIAPVETGAIDTLGPVPLSMSGNQLVVIFNDNYR